MIRTGIDPRTQASFTIGNRIARQLWACVYIVFFRFSPRPLHGYRAAILRLFGAKLGKNCHVYPSARIWAPWNLVMHDHAAIGDNVNCYSMAAITIGKNAVISQGAHLCTGTHDYESSTFQLYAKPIFIANRAWICAEAFIGPGVTVNEGAIAGARSVVSRDIPSWAVFAGNPARHIKLRVLRGGLTD
jgi:putative colanic acid biosynthesis acetyltransferase WcaF